MPVIAPGSDWDVNHCIISAGYTWCEILNKCIRLCKLFIFMKCNLNILFISFNAFSKLAYSKTLGHDNNKL